MAKNSERSALKITLKLFKRDGPIVRYRTVKRKRIYHLVEANDFAKAYLKVNYTKDDYNDGVYYSKEDLIQALSAFTEKSLVQYLFSLDQDKGDRHAES